MEPAAGGRRTGKGALIAYRNRTVGNQPRFQYRLNRRKRIGPLAQRTAPESQIGAAPIAAGRTAPDAHRPAPKGNRCGDDAFDRNNVIRLPLLPVRSDCAITRAMILS